MSDLSKNMIIISLWTYCFIFVNPAFSIPNDQIGVYCDVGISIEADTKLETVSGGIYYPERCKNDSGFYICYSRTTDTNVVQVKKLILHDPDDSDTFVFKKNRRILKTIKGDTNEN